MKPNIGTETKRGNGTGTETGRGTKEKKLKSNLLLLSKRHKFSSREYNMFS